jgi:hypothetical protein
MEPTNELWPQDAKGRVRVSVERREMLLGEFDRCGTSAASFAKRVGVKYQTFMYWLKRRREEGGERGAAQPRMATGWVEAVLDPRRDEAGDALRIELRGGGCVLVSNERQAQLAAELLEALSRKGRMELAC